MHARPVAGATLACAVLIFAGGCGGNGPRDARAVSSPGLAFQEVASAAGLGDFRHENGSEGRFWFPEQMGAGGGFVDYDGDGWEDIALAGGGRLSPSGPPDARALRLFRNNRDGTFTETTREAGLDGMRAWGTGITAADYDNDGDQDIFLATFGENLLFRNDSGPSGARFFTEVGRAAGVAGPAGWSSSPLFFDADLDGHLDLYVPGYAYWSLSSDMECFRVDGRPDYCRPATYPGAPGHFYRNNGDGTFTERTQASGLTGSPGKSLAVAEWDFNEDGWPDFVVANDGEPDLLYMNDGRGAFAEQGVRAGIAYGEHGEARAGMGVDIGVVDATGMPSVFVGNFSSEMIGVYRQTASGWFMDRAAASRIGQTSLTTLAFGVLLFDAELDGDLDLYVANGHVYLDPIDGSAYRQPPHLFVNRGEGTWVDMADSIGGAFTEAMVARAVAKADYDRDGDVDLLVTENNGPARLLRNDSSGGHVLRVRLSGRLDDGAGNLDALGAQVTITAAGVRQTRRVRTGSGYLSQSEKTLTFGLGSADRVDTLAVRWPDGRTERHVGIPAGHEAHVIRGEEMVSLAALPIVP